MAEESWGLIYLLQRDSLSLELERKSFGTPAIEFFWHNHRHTNGRFSVFKEHNIFASTQAGHAISSGKLMLTVQFNEKGHPEASRRKGRFHFDFDLLLRRGEWFRYQQAACTTYSSTYHTVEFIQVYFVQWLHKIKLCNWIKILFYFVQPLDKIKLSQFNKVEIVFSW